MHNPKIIKDEELYVCGQNWTHHCMRVDIMILFQIWVPKIHSHATPLVLIFLVQNRFKEHLPNYICYTQRWKCFSSLVSAKLTNHKSAEWCSNLEGHNLKHVNFLIFHLPLNFMFIYLFLTKLNNSRAITMNNHKFIC